MRLNGKAIPMRGVAGAVAVGIVVGATVSAVRSDVWESRVAGAEAEAEAAMLTDLHCRARNLLSADLGFSSELADLCAREWTELPAGDRSRCDRLADLDVEIKRQLGAWRTDPDSMFASNDQAYATGALRLHLRRAWFGGGCEPVPEMEAGFSDDILRWVWDADNRFERGLSRLVDKAQYGWVRRAWRPQHMVGCQPMRIIPLRANRRIAGRAARDPDRIAYCARSISAAANGPHA